MTKPGVFYDLNPSLRRKEAISRSLWKTTVLKVDEVYFIFSHRWQMTISPFTGKWSYRSFLNNPDLSVEFNKLQFGAGNLVLEEPRFGEIVGTLGDDGWSLDLKGWSSYGSPFEIRFQGSGIISEELWVYDYHGFLAPKWPNGNDQRAAIST
jgi:hypothetical protein